MTADGARDVFSGERPARQALGPLLTIRAMQVALWLLVISGPVAALLVATQMASLGGRLDVLSVGAGVELPPDTSGAQGFAELFIASYLGAGENSADGLSPFLDGVSLDGVEAGSWSATRTTSLGAEEMAPGYYAVMVAAEVVAADHDADGVGSGGDTLLLAFIHRDERAALRAELVRSPMTVASPVANATSGLTSAWLPGVLRISACPPCSVEVVLKRPESSRAKSLSGFALDRR
ncbi:MAG: hypothetical protein ACR2NT_14180, partial [Acidimicrobiia bacterium]